MATDYRINLAKSFTSTPEQRLRFYNGMLLYLALCAAAMVLSAYFSSANIQLYLANRQERNQLLATAAAVSGLDAAVFRDPAKSYGELQASHAQVGALKQALGQRVRLLPVVHNLFAELPKGVVLQSLSANSGKISFGLVMPPASAESGDSFRALKESWEGNEVLMAGITGIRPVTSERRMVGTVPVLYAQFECGLKK